MGRSEIVAVAMAGRREPGDSLAVVDRDERE